MSEKKRGRCQFKKLDSAIRGFNRNRISTMDWRSKLGFAPNFYSNDRGTRTYYYYLSYKEFSHSVAIIFVSSGAFGAGLGQLIFKLLEG